MSYADIGGERLRRGPRIPLGPMVETIELHGSVDHCSGLRSREATSRCEYTGPRAVRRILLRSFQDLLWLWKVRVEANKSRQAQT